MVDLSIATTTQRTIYNFSLRLDLIMKLLKSIARCIEKYLQNPYQKKASRVVVAVFYSRLHHPAAITTLSLLLRYLLT